MDFDPVSFFSVSVAGVPLIFVVIGLVQWLKDLGLKDKALKVSSLVCGLLLGSGYQLSQAAPTSFAGAFAVLVYGLALGLVASKVFDAGKLLADRAAAYALRRAIGAGAEDNDTPVQ